MRSVPLYIKMCERKIRTDRPFRTDKFFFFMYRYENGELLYDPTINGLKKNDVLLLVKFK